MFVSVKIYCKNEVPLPKKVQIKIGIFTTNRNRNWFAEPTSEQIGIGIVCELQNLQIGIGIIFVEWDVFANYSQITEIFFSLKLFSKNIFFLTGIYLYFNNLLCKQHHGDIHAYSLYIFNIRIRYSWILWRTFANRNDIFLITIFANRNNIHKIKLWHIGIGIYLWPKYQQID